MNYLYIKNFKKYIFNIELLEIDQEKQDFS